MSFLTQNLPVVFAQDGGIQWQVQFIATGNNSSDRNGVAAVAGDAVDGFDIYDVPNPPGLPGFLPWVDLYFTHPDWQTLWGEYYSTDARSPDSSIVWDFEVLSNFTDSVILSWDVSQIPSHYVSVKLQDAVTRETLVLDMRDVSEYVYASVRYLPRLFTFIVAGGVDPPLTPRPEPTQMPTPMPTPTPTPTLIPTPTPIPTPIPTPVPT
ncbi:hypothetical protein ACFLVI_04505, partial [Chloroflexota bacterium]